MIKEFYSNNLEVNGLTILALSFVATTGVYLTYRFWKWLLDKIFSKPISQGKTYTGSSTATLKMKGK